VIWGAALGAAAAYALTMLDPGWDWSWRKKSPFVAAAFESDFGWKNVVRLVVNGVRGFAVFTGRVFDKAWWDGVVEGSGTAARGAGGLLSDASRGRLNESLWWMAAGAALLLAAGGLR